jgi:hypothetical protein
MKAAITFPKIVLLTGLLIRCSSERKPKESRPYNTSASGQVNGSRISAQIPQSNNAEPTFAHTTSGKMLLLAAAAAGPRSERLCQKGVVVVLQKRQLRLEPQESGPAAIPSSGG